MRGHSYMGADSQGHPGPCPALRAPAVRWPPGFLSHPRQERSLQKSSQAFLPRPATQTHKGWVTSESPATSRPRRPRRLDKGRLGGSPVTLPDQRSVQPGCRTRHPCPGARAPDQSQSSAHGQASAAAQAPASAQASTTAE